MLWTGAARSADLPRANWLQNGVIDAGGSHEPYLFMVRRGGQRLDARQQSGAAQSRETILRLKAQGVEAFHTHLYKGFGMVAEMREMEETRRAAEFAHGIGLKVDTYVQWNTLMYETFFAEQPRARRWIERDASGRPILLSYGYQQAFRYRPCFSSQEYLNYLKKVLRYAVLEVKSDFIHFDNFDLNPEPESCHNPACVEAFRKYLREKYSPAQRRERFGFERMDYVNPPEWNKFNPPEKMRIISDPVIQEWISFRCQMMANALRQAALYVKSLNPEVAIEINPHGITGRNRPWEVGVDHSRLLKWTEVFWTENDPSPGYTSDGRLLSKIRSYKLARAYDNILFTYIAEDPVAMAESLAFNQTIGFAGITPLPTSAVSYGRNQTVGDAGIVPLPPDMLRYINFYRTNRELFQGSKDAATVAVLRSYASLTYNHASTQLGCILTEQALIQGGIPFDLIFDEHLLDLSKYKALILPESECLSDDQIALIQKFVMRGGGLVAIGQAGVYDEWRRLRPEPGLNDIFAAPSVPIESEAKSLAVSSIRTTYKSGRAVHIPELQFDGPLPPFTDYFPIDARFWKAPRNAREVVQAVQWAARGQIPIEAEGPAYLVSNIVEQPDRRRTIVHLVNYGAKSFPTMGPLQILCRLPTAREEVAVYSPDSERPSRIQGTRTASGLAFVLPELKVYSIAVIDW